MSAERASPSSGGGLGVPVRHFKKRGRGALERDAMAWPPARWERAPTAWRDDIWAPDPIPGEAPLREGPGRQSGVPAKVIVPGSPAWLPESEIQPTGREEQKAGPGLLRSVVEMFILTAVIFVGIRTVVQNFKIEGASMLPTLHGDQYVLVNKVAYRAFGDPQRGDIVVFRAWDGEKDYIKRIIGLPGDTVSVNDNQVIINGSPLDEPYVNGTTSGSRTGPLILGDDQFWVLGDNRSNSSDSRQHGALERDQLVGKAWLSYWPPRDMGLVQDGQASFSTRP